MSYYKIIHTATGKVVNLYSLDQTSAVTNGTRLLLYSWQNNNDQKWKLESVDGKILLRLARDTNKVMNRHSTNNNAIVWYYDGSAETKLDSLIYTEISGNYARIKLAGRNLYLTKNADNNYLSWQAKIDSDRQSFTMGKIDSKLITPLTTYSYISRGYTKGDHLGIDYVANQGTPILAAADGEVYYKQTYNQQNLNLPSNSYLTMGNCVYIYHQSIGMCLYMHMNAPCTLNVGDKVSCGQQIGTVGTTGNSTGYHLHFGLKIGSSFTKNSVDAYNQGEWVNPENYM